MNKIKEYKEQFDFAGFIILESKENTYTIREKSDNQVEIFKNGEIHDTHSNIDEALHAVSFSNKNMKKLNEAAAPTHTPEDWIQTDDGMDFVAELLMQAEEGNIRRYDIGMLLRLFDISSSAAYVNYFVGLLNGQGYPIK